MKDAAFSSARLLALYDRISDAEDAIPRLRRFVLDLAVRGKLVEQDASDEPAAELLKRIAQEKARLVKTGEIKNPKPLPPVEDDADFEVPPNWVWTRLGIITSYIQRGKSPKYAASDGSLVVSQKCVQWSGLDLSVAKQITLESLAQYEDIRFLRDGDLLWNSTGTGTIGRIIRIDQVPEKLVCDSHVTVVRSLLVDPEYIRLWVQSDHVYALIEGRAAGSTNQVELTAKMAINQVIPLPPLAEQRRIVAKVDELMALCDQLEQARAGREAVRDRLTTASLARLTAPETGGEAFQTRASFALQSLPTLTTRPDQIKPLRQTILNLAVRGKLVAQDPADGTGRELLKQVLAVPWTKKRKAIDLEPDEAAMASAFLPPANWTWATVQALTRTDQTVTYGILKPEWVDEGVPTVRVTEMKTGEIDVAVLPKCRPERAAKFAKTALEPGDLLVSKDGTIGKTAFVPPELAGGNITQHVLRFPICEQVDRRFVRLAIDAPFCQLWMVGETKGVALQGVNVGDFRRMPIPLPPLAEQHRIVAKVDALMALCDQLEASLTTTATTRSKLLNALLHEALEPAADELEAAE